MRSLQICVSRAPFTFNSKYSVKRNRPLTKEMTFLAQVLVNCSLVNKLLVTGDGKDVFPLLPRYCFPSDWGVLGWATKHLQMCSCSYWVKERNWGALEERTHRGSTELTLTRSTRGAKVPLG